MNDLKILYAFGFKDEHAMIVGYLKTKMVTELSAAGVNVERIEAVRTKQEIEEKMTEEGFNLLIVKEQLEEDKISSGAIKSWAQRYPKLKVILCVGNDKRGGEKLNRLLNTAPFYYDALYENDLTGSNVARLIGCSRSKEEAILYYGLEQRIDGEEEKTQPGILAGENLIVSEERPKEERDVVAEKRGDEPVSADISVASEDLEKVISGFDSMAFDVIEDAEEEDTNIKADKIEEPSKVTFDYTEMFAGNEMFGDSYKEKAFGVPKELLANEEEKLIIDATPDEISKESQEEKKMLKGLEEFFTNETKDGLPDAGKVLRVIDNNTMLVELCREPEFGPGKSMQDYELLFIVKGTRGGFVDGKYRVGVKSFEGYAGSLIGRKMVIVETPKYDLFENGLENEECSIICISQ